MVSILVELPTPKVAISIVVCVQREKTLHHGLFSFILHFSCCCFDFSCYWLSNLLSSRQFSKGCRYIQKGQTSDIPGLPYYVFIRKMKPKQGVGTRRCVCTLSVVVFCSLVVDLLFACSLEITCLLPIFQGCLPLFAWQFTTRRCVFAFHPLVCLSVFYKFIVLSKGGIFTTAG